MKTQEVWENYISINTHDDTLEPPLEPASAYVSQPPRRFFDQFIKEYDIAAAVERDPYPLPLTSQREGYYGEEHFNYWLSGLYSYRDLVDICEQYKVDLRSVLELGCASCRVLRHFACQYEGLEDIYGADINLKHINWINQHLPSSIVAFQNYSLPQLPLPDASVDLVMGFSVFTHVEAFDSFWLLELKRILRPGGIAYLTVQTERTWNEMDESWPIHNGISRHPDYAEARAAGAMPKEKLVFRWRGGRSYSSHVFLNRAYIHNVWGRIMKVEDIHAAKPDCYQDAVILRKGLDT